MYTSIPRNCDFSGSKIAVKKGLNQCNTLLCTLPRVPRIVKWVKKNTHTASRTVVDITRNVYVNCLSGGTSWICPQLWSLPTITSSLTTFANPLLDSLFFPTIWGHAVQFSQVQHTAVLVFLAYMSWVYRKPGSLLQKFSRKEFLGRLPKSCTVFLESSCGIW